MTEQHSHSFTTLGPLLSLNGQLLSFNKKKIKAKLKLLKVQIENEIGKVLSGMIVAPVFLPSLS